MYGFYRTKSLASLYWLQIIVQLSSSIEWNNRDLMELDAVTNKNET